MLQPQDLAQQHGLAGAGAADQRHHLATLDYQVQVLVHDRLLVAALENGPEFFDLDDGFSHGLDAHVLEQHGEQRVDQDHHGDGSHH